LIYNKPVEGDTAKMLCPDLDQHEEYYLEGNELRVNQSDFTKVTRARAIALTVTTCQNQPGVVCNDNKIREFLASNPSVYFAYNDSYVDFDNHPGRLFSDYINFDSNIPIDSNLEKTALYNVRPLYINGGEN